MTRWQATYSERCLFLILKLNRFKYTHNASIGSCNLSKEKRAACHLYINALFSRLPKLMNCWMMKWNPMTWVKLSELSGVITDSKEWEWIIMNIHFAATQTWWALQISMLEEVGWRNARLVLDQRKLIKCVCTVKAFFFFDKKHLFPAHNFKYEICKNLSKAIAA